MFLSTHTTKENVALKNINREYVAKCPKVTRAFIQSKLMVVLSVSHFRKKNGVFIYLNEQDIQREFTFEKNKIL